MINPILRNRAIFLFLSLVLLFLFCMRGMQFSYYPQRGRKVLSIRIELKGAWQDQIENLITNPLEEELLGMEGIGKMVSRSEDEKAVITLFLDDSADLDQSYLQLREILDRTSFPERTQKPQISKNDSNDLPVFILQMENPLSEEEVKSLLKQINGVGQVDISGIPKEDVFIPLDLDDLHSLNLSVQGIAGVIGRANVMGSIPVKQKGQTILLLDFRYSGLEDFTKQQLTDGLPIESLGKAVLVNTEQKSLSRVNGKDAVIAWIKESGDANTISLCRNLRKIRGELGETHIIYDKGILIEEALKGILKVLLLSLLSVIMLTLLILGSLKTSLLLCLNIPFSLCGTLALFRILGWNVDILVLAGLALATGMIIDSGVIYMEAGRKAGTRPILFSLLSTLLVFSSFLFASFEVKIQSAGLIRSLCISLSLSVFYILVLMHGFIQKQEPEAQTGGQNWVDSGFSLLHRFRYVSALFITLAIILSLFFISGLKMTREFQLPDPSLRFSLEYPAGTNLHQIEKEMKPFEKELLNWGESDFFTSEYREEKASFHIRLKEEKEREALRKRVIRTLGGSRGFLHFQDPGSTEGETVRLRAQDRTLLYETAENLASEIQRKTGKAVVLHYKKQPPLIVMIPRRETLNMIHLSPRDIVRVLENQLDRPVLGKWFPPAGSGFSQKVFDLRIADPLFSEKSWNDLKNTPIGPSVAETISTLSDFRDEVNYGSVYHEEGLRSVSFSLVESAPSPMIKKELGQYPLPENVRVDYGEESRERLQFRQGLMKSLVISMILLFLLLLFLYETLFLPLYLFSQILICHIFSLALLRIFGFPLSTPVFFALILNTGLLINNGLVIFGKYSGEKPGFAEVVLSVKNCALSLITAAVTTLGGLIPLLFKSSGSGGMLPALSLIVSSGILSSLILQMVMIPMVFKKDQEQRARVNPRRY